jgi:hypothetical protein
MEASISATLKIHDYILTLKVSEFLSLCYISLPNNRKCQVGRLLCIHCCFITYNTIHNNYKNHNKNMHKLSTYFSFPRNSAIADQGRLILQISISHTMSQPQSVGLLWSRDRPVVRSVFNT